LLILLFYLVRIDLIIIIIIIIVVVVVVVVAAAAAAAIAVVILMPIFYQNDSRMIFGICVFNKNIIKER